MTAAPAAGLEAPEGGRGTSLVLCSESVGEKEGPTGLKLCSKRPAWVVCDQDPTVRFPQSCDAYRCPTCGPRKARTAAAILTWGAAQVTRRRLVTLTAVPDDFQRARAQVRDYQRRLREDGYDFEWAWAIEANPRGTGFHAHGVQHGDYVPQRLLQDRWGGRRVDVRAMKTPGVGVYAVKEALRVAGYVTKGAGEQHGGLDAHLDRNGGRVYHSTRNFLHGLTKRQALFALTDDLRQGDSRTWHLEPVLGRGTA